MSSAQTKITTPRFTLWWTLNSRMDVDEQVWDQEHLRQRLVAVLVPGHEVSDVAWGVVGSDLQVAVERQDGLFLSSWRCPQCGAPETCWDSRPTAEMVISRLTSHSHIEGGFVTAPAGDVSESMTDAVTDVLADDVDEDDEDEAWESLPSVPVTSVYAESAIELEALEAGEAAEVGAGFFDSLVLVDAMGVAL